MSVQNRTILVVEDDEDLAVGLRFALEQDGHSVIVAPTLERAAAILSESRIDLVLLDVALPDGDGTELCRRIRSGALAGRTSSTPASVPVIFLTARDDETDVVRGLELGGDDYVAKPFRLRELLSRIKVRLRTSTAAPEGGPVVFRAGDLAINTATASVTKGENLLQLTALEYRLLLTLAQHSGQVLTRSQLVDRALGADGGVADDNTISVYIRRLREKIEDDPSSPDFIVTVRGVGYRFEEP